MSPLSVVGYEPARRRDLLELMETVWGAQMSEQEFEWWFERNPAGSPLISLAEDGERVVGVACMSPYRLLVDGAEASVPVPLHVATHPDYRGRGVFTRLEAENEARAAERSPIAITFPNEASRRVFASRLGWRDLPGPLVYVRPARQRPLPAGVARVSEFGPEADELWRRLASRAANGVVRDAAYLNWRFAEAPRPYTCLAAGDGIAVVGRKAVRGRRVAYLAELLAEPGPATGRLLRAALAAAEAPLLLAVPPHGWAADLLRLGFLPTPKRISVMGKELRPEGRLPPDWRFSLGDGDSF